MANTIQFSFTWTLERGVESEPVIRKGRGVVGLLMRCTKLDLTGHPSMTKQRHFEFVQSGQYNPFLTENNTWEGIGHWRG